MLGLGSERTQVFRVSYAEYKKYLSDCETVRGSYIGAKPNYQEVSTIEVIVPQMTQNVTSKVSANEVMCYYVDGKRVRRERVAYAIQNGLVQEKITDTNERSRREKLNEELHAGEWILTSCKNKNGTLSYLINGVKILKDELILNVEYYYHGEWKNCREVKADSGVRELLTSDRRSLFSGKELDWKTMKYVSCASYLDGKITWLDETDEQVEEIDASEYAVSVEAQEVAVGAEIENAASAAEKCDKKFSKERCEMTMEIKASAVSAEIESASIEFDAAKMAQEETAVNAELNEWVAEMVAAMKAELAETEAALKKLEAEIAANGVTVKRIAMKAAYEAEISEMKRNLENYVVNESAAENAVEEIDASEYAVSVEAQEVAIGAEIENAATDKLFVVKVMLESGNIEEYEVPSLHWACNSMRGAREYYKENYELEIIGDKTGRIYYKVDSAGKVVIDEIDWAEYANAEMIHSIGEYAVDADAAAEVEELNAAAQPTMLDKLKAKVAEQKNRLKKSVIDWAGTLKDYAKKDFYILQNDLKRFIELGEIELAAKTFETIKEKYRTLYAA